FIGGARPVLGRECVQGQRLDAELACGPGDIADAVCSLAMTLDARTIPPRRPATITVPDDADVARQTAGCHRCGCPIDLVGSMKAMGIFSRLGTLIKSNINDLITKAEDPEKMLSQVLLEMQQQLVEAKKAVAMAIADEKRLQKQYNAELDKAKEWERKAMLAVRAGDDNLARQALVRKQEHENISSQFQQQWIAQKAAVDKLKD